MSVALAVALLALLVALFALVALVAVYARVRGLEAAGDVSVSGYPALVGRPAPASVRPGPGQAGSLVAVVDADCALCGAVGEALADAETHADLRMVALTDRASGGVSPHVLVDVAARGDLFEGYTPTVLAVDAAGTVVARRFVYADTDLAGLLGELATRAGHRTRPSESEASRT